MYVWERCRWRAGAKNGGELAANLMGRDTRGGRRGAVLALATLTLNLTGRTPICAS